jgi:hypothetical protein
LPDRVYKVGIGRTESGSPHIRGNLPAMVCRVHDDVQQNILLLAGELFSLRVFVIDRVRETGLAK